MLWLIPLLVGIAGAAAAATDQGIPDWGRWTLAGIALAGAILGIAVLIGPAARPLAGDRHPLTQAERRSSACKSSPARCSWSTGCPRWGIVRGR
ncbi:hypothetical protein [Nonomuraea turcica]|uniref:hypothetical protein n=1 Tax=Nonomuraea sp. G32 TaxID=3067274 RepID=UPI00273C04A0|nr:hypothetical protein [Nonomuraea sp. G32]MDP4510362.1 hypothetical protein [Nonomuraea sp. G32]